MARISSGTMTVVVFAILLGLGGAFVVRQEMARPKNEVTLPEPPPQAIVVPVAAMDLEPGQNLVLTDVALMKFTPEQFAKSKYAGSTYMGTPGQILGRTLKMGLRKGEVFVPEFLYPEGLGPGISDRLTAGYRAVTVPIENVGAVQGFARPGTWVDVLFRSSPVQKARREMTLTLLERVEVLAINENLIPNRQMDVKSLGTVTLSVTPHQAKILKVVEGRGELSLALRHPDDTLDMAPFTIGQLDPSMGVMNLFPDAIAVSHTTTERAERVDRVDRADRVDGAGRGADTGVDRSDRSGSNDRESMDGVLGNSSERITLDDLLGFGQEPEKRQIEIYLGAQKTVIEVNEPTEDQAPVLTPTGRIRTPIAHGPALPSTRPVSRLKKTPVVQPETVVSRDRS